MSQTGHITMASYLVLKLDCLRRVVQRMSKFALGSTIMCALPCQRLFFAEFSKLTDYNYLAREFFGHCSGWINKSQP